MTALPEAPSVTEMGVVKVSTPDVFPGPSNVQPTWV